MRDVLKKCVLMDDGEKSLLILGLENQSDIHYAMPVKNMIYDALNYGQQVNQLAKKNRKEKRTENSAEFLSGLRKDDKLKPVITLVVYWGGDDWDGPRSLKEMLDTSDATILQHVSDYKLNLIVPKEILDFGKFSTDFGTVIHYIAISNDMEALRKLIDDPSFQEVENESVRLINEFTNSNIPIEEGKECTNMCQGLQELLKDEREEGRIEFIVSLLKAGATKELLLASCTEEEIAEAEKELLSKV